jgi:hypothetical protein
MVKIPNYTGIDSENPERPEIEHFGNCEVCGALVDMPGAGEQLGRVRTGAEP